jgi:NAD(P)H-nitrite reductase large subunit
MTRYVIIGNGIAGISAAETIRSLDRDGSITIIAKEKFPPYSRPMISLALEGSIRHDQLSIRPADFYSRFGIEALVGERALSIDVDNRQVVTVQTGTLEYDRLLIASGADPRPIKAAGTNLANVTYMRTEAHVAKMLQALPEIKHALVLGGGLVGFKAAYGLLRRGIGVTMLIRSSYPLSMQLDGTAGQLVLSELKANGLEVRTGVEATAFVGTNAVQEAHLSDGSHLTCQLVVIGKGVLPALDFVPRDRIQTDLGIVVDNHLQTSVPGVFAAGDVAQAMDAVRKRSWVNAIWPVAVEQGRLAGANMAGRPVSYHGSLGRNVMRIFRLDIMSGGIVTAPGNNGYRVLSRFDPLKRTYRRVILRGDTPVGMVLVGDVEQGGVLLSLIQRRQPLAVDPESLLESSFNCGTICA